jgi:hypothetical protein
MRISHLFEYDQSKTLANFETKLADRVNQSSNDIESLLRKFHPSDGALDEVKPFFGKWALAFIEEADPTKQKAFVVPFCRWYIGKEIRFLEDFWRAKEAVAAFVKFKNRLKGIDLRTISFDDFEAKMDEMKNTLSRSEMWKEREKSFYENGQAELIRNDEEIKIVVPKTEEASCFFGTNTKWCTAATSGWNAFSDYSEKGPLYIVLFKKENTRWQFHFQTMQFMNERDEEILIEDIQNSIIVDWFETMIRENIELSPSSVLMIRKPTHDDLFRSIATDQGMFYYLGDVADDSFYREVLHRLVSQKNDGEMIEADMGGTAFLNIKKKTIDDMRLVLQLKGELIGKIIGFPGVDRAVRNELAEIAVDTNGNALAFWKGPVSDDLALRAIKTAPSAYAFLLQNYDEEPDGVPEELQMKAVEVNPMVLSQMLEKPSEQICQYAVEKNPKVVRWIKNASIATCQKAVKVMLRWGWPSQYAFGEVFASMPTKVIHDPSFVEWMKKQCERELKNVPDQRVRNGFEQYLKTGSPKSFGLT